MFVSSNSAKIPEFVLPEEPDMVVIVASLMKLWLRELLDGIVPAHHFNDFKEATDVQKLEKAVKDLPVLNKACLEYLLRFLNDLSKFSDQNKMTPSNIGIVFGPTVFRTPSEANPTSTNYMLESMSSTEFIINMLTNIDVLFPSGTPGFSITPLNAVAPTPAE
jgi:Rho GTPase-activating protein 9